MQVRGWASAAVVAALALALSACGGEGETAAGAEVASRGDGSASTNRSNGSPTASDRREGALEFAKCMREHGIDHPDPDENGMFAIEPDQGFDPRSETFQEAARACEKYLAAMGAPPELSAEERKKMEEQMLAFAHCMREQGIDMPDPTFGGEGGSFALELPRGTDPRDPDFRAAQEACREYSPEAAAPSAGG